MRKIDVDYLKERIAGEVTNPAKNGFLKTAFDGFIDQVMVIIDTMPTIREKARKKTEDVE